jgi:glycerol transport system ATP-binding protein
MNVLPARIEGATARVDGHAIPLSRPYASLPTGAQVEIGIRPEHLSLVHSGGGLPVTVQRVDDIGRLKVARVRLGDRPLNVVMPESARIEGSAAHAVFMPDRIHVYADSHIVEPEAA